MAYSTYKEKTAMIQKYSKKATSPNCVWLSGRMHIEERLYEGPRLQRKNIKTKTKQNKLKLHRDDKTQARNGERWEI